MKKLIYFFCFLCGCMACTEENSFLENKPSTKPTFITPPDTLSPTPPQTTDTVAVNNWNTVIGGVIILQDVK